VILVEVRTDEGVAGFGQIRGGNRGSRHRV
jgi:hypothetical protein